MPTRTTEVTYPTTPVSPLGSSSYSLSAGLGYTAAVPGLYNNAHKAGPFSGFGDPRGLDTIIVETSAWTEDDGAGWENGYFNYGYTNTSGVYIPLGSESIPGAKHLSAAYMEEAGKVFIVVAYTVKLPVYNEVKPCVWTRAVGGFYHYAQEYRIYEWSALTTPIVLTKRGRIAGSTPLPPCHPLYVAGSGPLAGGYYGDFAFDGTIVMDVSADAHKVAFAWTGNGGAVRLTVANIIPTNPPTLATTSRELAGYPAANPLDIAIRQEEHPSGPKYFIYTLIPNGSGGCFVSQNEYAYVITSSGVAPQADDFYTGAIPSTALDHLKLDVPDKGFERRWAYTFSDGTNIYLRRFYAPSSNSPAGTGVTHIINDGMLQDASGTFQNAINSAMNFAPAIAYKDSSSNIKLAWHTEATAPYSGTHNWVAVELAEDPVWINPPTVVNTMDYLDVQSNNTAEATKLLALSHHSSSTANLLYTTFGLFDNVHDQYLQHKNHDMTFSSTWRVAQPSSVLATVQQEYFAVSPNPFIEKCSINSNATGTINVRIIDIVGRNIATLNGKLNELNEQLQAQTSKLASGTYLLYINSDNTAQQILKITKQ